MNPLLIAFYRTLIFYFALVAAVRIMGKREVANLAPTDLVVAILLADLAVIPIESGDVPILMGLIPIATIAVLQILLSYTSLKNLFVRQVFDGTHTVMIRGGKIDVQAMRSNRYTLDELMTHLREKGFPDLADVEFAVLETDGEMSVIPKSQKRPLTAADLGLVTQYEGMPHVLVKDGQVMYKELDAVGLDQDWLEGELKKQGFDKGSQSVLVASLNTKGELYFQPKDES